jgi:iron complex outermembrane receptor protein
VPDWTASGGIQYIVEDERLHGSITPRLDWFYTGTIAYNAQQPQHDEPAYSVFNGRVTYANYDYDLEISLGATNLFNKFYYRQKTIFRALGLPTNLGQPASPREWYLSMKKRF